MINSLIASMEKSNKIWLAIVFFLLPFLLGFVITPLGSGFDFVLFARSIIKQLFLWLSLAFSIYIFLYIFRGKGHYGFLGILNKISVIYLIVFIFSLVFFITLLIMLPQYFSLIRSLAASSNLTTVEISDAINSLDLDRIINSNLVLGFIFLFILSFVAFFFCLYVCYITIAQYAKSSFLFNVLILILSLGLFTVFSYFISLFL